jgi:hypothetical protein
MELPKELCDIIIEYTGTPIVGYKDSEGELFGIESMRIWNYMSGCEDETILRHHLRGCGQINWESLSMNESDLAVKTLIHRYPGKIMWERFSRNENTLAVKYSLANLKMVSFREFSKNENDFAVDFLVKHPDKIYYVSLALNENTKAVELTKKYLLNFFPKNDNDRRYVKSVMCNFSTNTNDEAVKFLIKYPEFIIRGNFLANPNDLVLDYLEENPHLMSWGTNKYGNYQENKWVKFNPNERMRKIREKISGKFLIWSGKNYTYVRDMMFNNQTRTHREPPWNSFIESSVYLFANCNDHMVKHLINRYDVNIPKYSIWFVQNSNPIAIHFMVTACPNLEPKPFRSKRFKSYLHLLMGH